MVKLTHKNVQYVDFYGDHILSYSFDISCNDTRVGDIRLRIGNTEGIYYSGHIGFAVDEAHRGKGYAVQACRLLTPIARHHGMTKLIISNDDGNLASYRVCEKLGAKLVCKAELPDWHDAYKQGHRYKNIFEWDLMENGNQQSYAK